MKALLACAALVGALLAAPAPAQAAAPAFTVSPGGAWSGTRAPDGAVGIRDAVSNQVTLCSGLTVAGIALTLDDANGCHAVVGARASGPGFTGLAYPSTDACLSFASGGKGLVVQSAPAQCGTGTAGLDVKRFDRISLGGFGTTLVDSTVTPPQRISSP